MQLRFFTSWKCYTNPLTLQSHQMAQFNVPKSHRTQSSLVCSSEFKQCAIKLINTCGFSVRRRVCSVSNTALRTDEMLCLMNGQSLWTRTLRGWPRPEWTQADGWDRRVASRFMMLLVDAERSSRSTRVSQSVCRIRITWRGKERDWGGCSKLQ